MTIIPITSIAPSPTQLLSPLSYLISNRPKCFSHHPNARTRRFYSMKVPQTLHSLHFQRNRAFISPFSRHSPLLHQCTQNLASLGPFPLLSTQFRHFQNDFPKRPPRSKVLIYYADHRFTPSQIATLEKEIPSVCNVYVVVTEYPLDMNSMSLLSRGSHSQMPPSQIVATDIFNNQWHLPPNGVLVYMSVMDRRIEIITGAQMEHCLRPTFLSEMQQRHMIPYFKKGQLYEGLRTGLSQIVQRMEWWDGLDAEERLEEAQKKQYHYVDAKPGLPRAGEDREREADEFVNQLNSVPSTDASSNLHIPKTSGGSSGRGGNNNSNSSMFNLNMPTHNSRLDVEADSRTMYALVAFFVATVGLFALLMKKLMRPACPECGSKKTKKKVSCKDHIARYKQYVEWKKEQGEDVDEDTPMILDKHGSEMVHFDEASLRTAFEECLTQLVPGNWREMELGSVNYQVRHCQNCSSDFAVSEKKLFAKHSDCPHCHFRGYKQESRVVESNPTYVSDGVALVQYQCHVCDYTHSERVLIPKITRTSHSSSGSSGGGSSGGSSGSGAGASW